MTPAEKRVLEALDKPMTRKQWAEKIGYKTSVLNDVARKLEALGCVTCVGMQGKSKLFEATGKMPNENKTLGFTIFGVRI
jgi:GTP-sensing pleiotropic transcriptional regulator CodY